MPAKVYNLANVVCTVGGVPVNEYGTDSEDAIALEWSSSIMTAKPTADGKYVYSRTNDRGLVATITLSRKSTSIPLLMALIEAQTGDNIGIAPPVVVPMPFFLTDPATGDVVAAMEFVFMDRPAPTFGKEAGDVEFVLHMANPKYTLGSANLLTI